MKKIVKLFGVMTIAAALLISCKPSTDDTTTDETPNSEAPAPADTGSGNTGNGAAGDAETPAEKGITVSLKGANVAAYGATTTEKPTENEDGSCTYTTSGQYSGGGFYFFINEDKSAVELAGKVIKIEMEYEKDGWDLTTEPNFCLKLTDAATPGFWSGNKALQYKDGADNKVSFNFNIDTDEKSDGFDLTKATAIGVQLNTYNTEADENDKVKVTIKSIKIVDAE